MLNSLKQNHVCILSSSFIFLGVLSATDCIAATFTVFERGVGWVVIAILFFYTDHLQVH